MRSFRTRSLPRALTAGALIAASLAAGAATGADAHRAAHRAPAGDAVSDRRAAAAIRRAVARYHDVDRAVADGYQPTTTCSELPGTGGMGYHYVNPRLAADAVVDPARPEILVYHRDGEGRLRLGAAEWFVADPDQDLTTDAGRPTLFGHPFDGPMAGHEPGMPAHFDLHAWVGTPNPAGLFAAWNPRVHCP